MLIKDAEINGELLDIRCRNRNIVELGVGLAGGDDEVWDARGGCGLPGLHDHHLHFFALAAARRSLDLHGLHNPAQFTRALAGVRGSGWLRGVGYHESMVGDLNHQELSRYVPDRPARLQHSSGKMWLLNTRAVEELGLAGIDEPGIERDPRGMPTGRLFRMDAWLAGALSQDAGEIQARRAAGEATGAYLASLGITGFTDASYTNGPAASGHFAALPQKVWLMGNDDLQHGPLKIMLDEDRLPGLEDLVLRIKAARVHRRRVAFHCVSRVELLLAMAALSEVGAMEGDRIEHGGVIPTQCLPGLRALEVCVVTQPGFIAHRGERFCAGVPREEWEDLYRYQSLLDAGIPVAASSDAPYGPVNPWQVMQAAVHRCTDGGRVLGPGERVCAEEALRGYLAKPTSPGGSARRIEPGETADLVILCQGWQAVVKDLANTQVRFTVVNGNVVYSSSARMSA